LHRALCFEEGTVAIVEVYAERASAFVPMLLRSIVNSFKYSTEHAVDLAIAAARSFAATPTGGPRFALSPVVLNRLMIAARLELHFVPPRDAARILLRASVPPAVEEACIACSSVDGAIAPADVGDDDDGGDAAGDAKGMDLLGRVALRLAPMAVEPRILRQMLDVDGGDEEGTAEPLPVQVDAGDAALDAGWEDVDAIEAVAVEPSATPIVPPLTPTGPSWRLLDAVWAGALVRVANSPRRAVPATLWLELCDPGFGASGGACRATLARPRAVRACTEELIALIGCCSADPGATANAASALAERAVRAWPTVTGPLNSPVDAATVEMLDAWRSAAEALRETSAGWQVFALGCVAACRSQAVAEAERFTACALQATRRDDESFEAGATVAASINEVLCRTCIRQPPAGVMKLLWDAYRRGSSGAPLRCTVHMLEAAALCSPAVHAPDLADVLGGLQAQLLSLPQATVIELVGALQRVQPAFAELEAIRPPLFVSFLARLSLHLSNFAAEWAEDPVGVCVVADVLHRSGCLHDASYAVVAATMQADITRDRAVLAAAVDSEANALDDGAAHGLVTVPDMRPIGGVTPLQFQEPGPGGNVCSPDAISRWISCEAVGIDDVAAAVEWAGTATVCAALAGGDGSPSRAAALKSRLERRA
jgi:hypothetical protein